MLGHCWHEPEAVELHLHKDKLEYEYEIVDYAMISNVDTVLNTSIRSAYHHVRRSKVLLSTLGNEESARLGPAPLRGAGAKYE